MYELQTTFVGIRKQYINIVLRLNTSTPVGDLHPYSQVFEIKQPDPDHYGFFPTDDPDP
jgi:hypothetical protein